MLNMKPKLRLITSAAVFTLLPTGILFFNDLSFYYKSRLSTIWMYISTYSRLILFLLYFCAAACFLLFSVFTVYKTQNGARRFALRTARPRHRCAPCAFRAAAACARRTCAAYLSICVERAVHVGRYPAYRACFSPPAKPRAKSIKKAASSHLIFAGAEDAAFLRLRFRRRLRCTGTARGGIPAQQAKANP